jgi:uncharacterized protein
MKRILKTPVRRPRLTLLAAGLATLAALIGANHLRFEASLDAMFPRNDRAADAMERVLDRFSTADELLVLVTGDPERLSAFADRFSQAVSAAPAGQLAEKVVIGVDPDAEQFIEHELAPAALFYLDDAELAAARQRLTPQGMREQLVRDRAMLAQPGPGAGAIAKALMADPLDLHDFLLPRLAAASPISDFAHPDALLIRVLGRRPPTDLTYAAALTESVSAAIQQASPDGLQVSLAGAYAVAAEDQASIRRDAIESVTGSVALLLLLFIAVYRRPIRLFHLAFGPVAVGIFWGFGAYGVLRGQVSPIAAVIGGVLAGMGIDYSVLYLTRFEELRLGGATARQAAEQTAGDISAAIFAAFITSVAGFLAIGFSSVKALRDFAIMGTLGLCGCFIAALTVGPALLVLLPERQARPAFRFVMNPLLRWMIRYRRGLYAAGGAIALACVVIIAIPGGALIQPESDLTAMHPRPNAALDAESEITRRFGIAPGVLLIDTQASDERSLVAMSHEIQRRLAQSSVTQAGIAGTYGLANWLPDPAVAAARAAAIRPGDGDRAAADFDAAAKASGFNLAPFAGYESFLKTLLQPAGPPGIEALRRYPGLSRDFLPDGSGDGDKEAITVVFLRSALENRTERDAAIDAVQSALTGLDGTQLTGLPVISHDAEEAVSVELPHLLWIAMALVAAYLLLHFRNIRLMALSLLPAAFGFLTLAAMVRVVGIRLNLMNLIALPLLIGIDVDYGIYLVSLSRRGRKDSALAGGAHAVCVCATSMIAGYGSLVFTSVPALQSLGLVVAVGAAMCLAGAIFILCPLLGAGELHGDEIA